MSTAVFELCALLKCFVSHGRTGAVDVRCRDEMGAKAREVPSSSSPCAFLVLRSLPRRSQLARRSVTVHGTPHTAASQSQSSESRPQTQQNGRLRGERRRWSGRGKADARLEDHGVATAPETRPLLTCAPPVVTSARPISTPPRYFTTSVTSSLSFSATRHGMTPRHCVWPPTHQQNHSSQAEPIPLRADVSY